MGYLGDRDTLWVAGYLGDGDTFQSLVYLHFLDALLTYGYLS